MPDKQKKYIVTLPIMEGTTPKQVEIEVFATNEANAINKAKVELSVDRKGNNYQVIAGAFVSESLK